jgi:hypothetical protein
VLSVSIRVSGLRMRGSYNILDSEASHLKLSVPRCARRTVRVFPRPRNSSTIGNNRHCAVAMTCTGANHALALDL